MHVGPILQWLNRHGTSTVLFVVLLGAGAGTHLLAHVRMEAAGRQFAIMNELTYTQMQLIEFMHANAWMAVAYGVLSLICMLRLEYRRAPRWVVWLTFCIWALPCLDYITACLHISFKFFR